MQICHFRMVSDHKRQHGIHALSNLMSFNPDGPYLTAKCDSQWIQPDGCYHLTSVSLYDELPNLYMSRRCWCADLRLPSGTKVFLPYHTSLHMRWQSPYTLSQQWETTTTFGRTGIQASRGKGTRRCHCESPWQAAIKSVHKRNLRESREYLKAFILKL